MRTRKLKASEVTFEVVVEPDDMPVRVAFSSGDPEKDQIIEAIEAGSVEAWCCISVIARWTAKDGTKFDGTDHLGGCSFLAGVHQSVTAQVEDCVDDHGMRQEALARLQTEVDAANRREAEHKVLEALHALPKKTLESWVKRSFMTVLPLAKAEIAFRKLR